MSDEQRFSRITVSSPDDDEIVIRAGAPRGLADEADRPAEAAFERAGSAAAPAAEPVAAAEAAPTTPDSSDDEPVAPSRRKDDAYHETTLEDLEGGKAPLVQKIVIVAAVVLIACFIVYQVAFA